MENILNSFNSNQQIPPFDFFNGNIQGQPWQLIDENVRMSFMGNKQIKILQKNSSLQNKVLLEKKINICKKSYEKQHKNCQNSKKRVYTTVKQSKKQQQNCLIDNYIRSRLVTVKNDKEHLPHLGQQKRNLYILKLKKQKHLSPLSKRYNQKVQHRKKAKSQLISKNYDISNTLICKNIFGQIPMPCKQIKPKKILNPVLYHKKNKRIRI